MAANNITAVMAEPNGRKFSKFFKADTEAHARALATAELKLTSGTLISETISLAVTPQDPVNGSASYSDAEFTFKNGTKSVNVHFEQLSNGYADANVDGYVDTGNADISNWAVAWSVAHGGGYTLHSGKYIR